MQTSWAIANSFSRLWSKKAYTCKVARTHGKVPAPRLRLCRQKIWHRATVTWCNSLTSCHVYTFDTMETSNSVEQPSRNRYVTNQRVAPVVLHFERGRPGWGQMHSPHSLAGFCPMYQLNAAQIGRAGPEVSSHAKCWSNV